MVLFIYFYWKNALGWWYLLGVCELSLSLCSSFSYSGKEGWAPAAYLRKMQDGVMAGNQTTETNKPAVQGQVEIIGNLMEISNLLNKKPSNERHSHTQTDTTAHRNSTTNTYRNSQSDTYTQYNSDTEQTDAYSNNTHSDRNSSSVSTAANAASSSLERDFNDQVTQHTDTSVRLSVSDSSVSVSVSDACVIPSISEASVSSTSSAIKTKTVPPSPAIARVAPQRFHSVETSEFLVHYLVHFHFYFPFCAFFISLFLFPWLCSCISMFLSPPFSFYLNSYLFPI